MSAHEATVHFFEEDFPRTLFPLETNRLLVTISSDMLSDFVRKKILPKIESFLPQTRVYAAKPGLHLRRTVCLDPIASFYLYDLIHRNRTSFRKDVKKTRKNFGFRFEKGQLLSPRTSYREFKYATSEALKHFTFAVKFDISAYFNSVYHHDLVGWFNDGSRSDDDVTGFDSFLKQTNAGRSVDCLPQGIAPAKIVGSHFLKFIDNSNRLRSALTLRYMDDFLFCSTDEDVIQNDFVLAQRLLGEKGLSVNPSKTMLGTANHVDIKKEIDAIKLSLLRVRTRVVDFYDHSESEEDEDQEFDEDFLSAEQVQYLVDLLNNPQIEEEDAELVLSLLRERSEEVTDHIGDFLERFPNLIKSVFHFCHHIADPTLLGRTVSDYLAKERPATEFQLFWLGKIAESYLPQTAQFGEILIKLYEHPNASLISKAKILEIPEMRFGMKDLREEHLKSGRSDWLAWAAAVGSRLEKKANRNHLLSYFSNGGPMNALIYQTLQRI
jgi:hypothetical protein